LQKWGEDGLSRPFIDGGRWVVFARRKHPRAKEFIEKEMGHASLGNDLRRLRGLEVFDMKSMSSSEFSAPLSALLDKRRPWEI
jgi:hypothetical protein